MYNYVVLVGRATHDPELSRTSKGDVYTRFRIAVERPRFKGMDAKADFLSVVAFKKNAQNICQYLGKGRLCLVEGSLEQDPWTDRYGQRREDVTIKARRVVFLEFGRQKKALEDMADFEGIELIPPEIKESVSREIDMKYDEDMPIDITGNGEKSNDGN